MSQAIQLLRALADTYDAEYECDAFRYAMRKANAYLAATPSANEDLASRLRDAAAATNCAELVNLWNEAADALSEKALPEVTTNDQQQPEK